MGCSILYEKVNLYWTIFTNDKDDLVLATGMRFPNT